MPSWAGFPNGYLFNRLKAGEQAVITAMEQDLRSYEPQTVIVREGDIADRIFRIVSGRAVRRRTLADGRTQLAAVFLPGDIFGAHFAASHLLGASVEAQTALSVQSIHRDEAVNLLVTNPDVALWCIWRHHGEAARTDRWVTVLSHGNALEKIAVLLLDFHERMGITHQPQIIPLSVPLTQRDVAEYLGLTLPHVCRTFKVLRDRGIVKVRYGVIQIVDRPGLVACAENIIDFWDDGIGAMRYDSTTASAEGSPDALELAWHRSSSRHSCDNSGLSICTR